MDSGTFWRLATPGFVLVAALIVLLVVAILVRAWMFRQVRASSTEPFTLEELKEMRRMGRISDPEYENLRRTLLERMDIRADRGRPTGP